MSQTEKDVKRCRGCIAEQFKFKYDLPHTCLRGNKPTDKPAVKEDAWESPTWDEP